MIRTYSYKLYANKRTEAKFNKWLGICRYVYNVAKETKEIAYKSGINLRGYDLSNQLTEAKKALPWIAEVHSHTLQGVLERLDNSYKRFFSGQNKYPKWASKKTWKSFGFKQYNATITNPKGALRQTDKGFKLPVFGDVKVFNNKPIVGIIKTAKLH